MSDRRGIRRGLGWLAALVLAAGSGTVHATSVREMSIVDLLEHSQTIVAGRVEKVTDGIGPNGVPFTEVTLAVTDPIRGTKGKTHTFRQFGLDKPRTLPDGRVYLGSRPQGWPTWRKGEVALVFLYPKARLTGLQTTVGLGYGKLSLGNGLALNAHENASLFQNVKVKPCAPQQRRTRHVRNEERPGQRQDAEQVPASRGRGQLVAEGEHC